ncbi:free fatty acid receptor 3 [Triplophysa rosa]|uniref:Free fatty acid receptor 3-like n=1 Tax=Triplophysa rosa TaxID=992332 RepID=A0A9W7TMC8_TRIRA|nr:free fatty acid receptor 3 [Triplophysa rosa]KAI7798998.1 free fatty acid receptor 3-like [Triplophysa rosa]
MSEDTPTAVVLSIYIITFLIGFPNSVLAICSCIRKIRSKPLPIDLFMLNLVVSDLIFLTYLPVKMKEAADNMVWNMPYILCHFNLFTFFLPLYSSSQFLAAISVERYVCVAFPVKYKSPRRFTYTILVCVAIWMLIIIIAGLTYKAVYTGSDETENITNHIEPSRCYNNFTAVQLKGLLKMRLAVMAIFFCIPLIICCFCYINAIRILLKLPLIKRCRRLRVIGLTLGTLLVFTVCFAPYNASHIVGYIREENPKWRTKVLMLTTLNACFDPIIFYCISWEMRNAIKICVKRFLQLFNCLK